ncbi:MAG TPA: NUDIX domain-containing protein [Caldisericia bacterium]|nr:NUDIX domain-containing protein [Caldisericia bacterium]HPP43256.1 NUDIX domain-containing protein [Caldisericia bacterium]HRU73611.1 NUDIX domain-containing protein [Caldisericia bacterium]
MKKLISAGGVIIYQNKVLLLKREKSWVFPKGKVKEGESLIQTAIREIFEETGIKVNDKSIEIGNTNYKYMTNDEQFEKTVYYYLFIVSDVSVNIEKTFLGYGWFYFDEALKYVTYKNDKKILKNAIKKLREVF